MQVTKRLPAKKTIKTSAKIALVILALGSLSACVTQNFSEDKPVVDRDFSNEQIAKTRISLALGYLKIGSTTQAKQNLEKAKQYAPRLVEVHTAFAHYFESVGEYKQTEQAYLTALDINKDDPNTLNNFGVFLCRQNRIDEAEKYFLQAIKVPTYIRVSESYENIALCYLKENNFAKAEHAIERSIAHSPNSSSSLFQMAQLQYAKRNYIQSAKYISRFELATRRFTAQAIALAYKVNQKLGNEEIAQSYATMLLKMFPESLQAQEYLDNGLVQIEADNLAFQYRKYKLLKSGVKVNKKPIVVTKKKLNYNDDLKQKQPQIQVNDEKLVDDETIFEETSQSIAKNSKIANQGQKQVAATPLPNSKATVQKPVVTPAKQNTLVQSSQINQNTVVNKSAPAAQANQTAVIPTVSSTPVTVNQTAISSSKLNDTKTVHVVQAGDNLYQISVKYNIMISSLRRWNNLTKETIKVGQELRLTKPE